MPMRILGISAFYHDSAAALVQDGHIVAAAQEERFSRKKQDARYPENAIRYCLDEAGLTLDEIDHVVFYEKPFIKFERLLETYLGFAPRGFRSFRMAMPVWLREKLWVPSTIREKLGYRGEILYAEHHVSHAASAFLLSPFEESAILTADGIGEWASTTVGVGRGTSIELVKELQIPHSELIIRKGYRKPIDSYSAFYEADGKTPTGLVGYLRERGLKQVFLVGLATDFCVAWSAMDARKAGFAAYVIEDATRGIDADGSLAKAWKDMLGAGVKRIQSADLDV